MEEVTTYRVYNKCKFHIGVKDANNQPISIAPGDFAIMSARDIAHTENLCTHDKFFAKKMLVPYDEKGNEVAISLIGSGTMKEDNQPHLSREEVEAVLKGSAKKLEAYLNSLDDPAEIYQIIEIAKEMDLNASKLKLLAAKSPDADLLSVYN